MNDIIKAAVFGTAGWFAHKYRREIGDLWDEMKEKFQESRRKHEAADRAEEQQSN